VTLFLSFDFVVCFVELQIEDLVVVSLNEGVVRFPQSLETTSLPSEPVAEFKSSVNNLMSQLDVWQLETYVMSVGLVQTSSNINR